MSTTRPRGFLDTWNRKPKTQELLEHVQAVLEDEAEYLPLTIRQIFYRLVVRGALNKTERAY